MKILHYCWFGGKLQPNVEARINRWRALHPTWKVQEWNDANARFDKCLYARTAATTHSWAYLSDYVRLQALYEHGGVYLDTDVELLQPIDELADGALHMGYMHNCALGTAVIISPPRHPVIRHLLAFYEQLEGRRMINNNAVFTEYFLQEVADFKLDGASWSGPTVAIHSKRIFEQPGLFRRGYAVHLYNQSWGQPKNQESSLQRGGGDILFALKRMFRSWLEESRCVYFRYYLRDRYNLPVHPPALGLSFAASRR